jgi:hypothetical protein
MTDIDFLPLECRRQCQQRHARQWQIVALTAVFGLVAAAAITQHHHWRRAQADLAAITPAYEAAVHLHSRIAGVQEQLSRARARAELCTYLRHPWPRTQLLAAMVGPLPEEITLQQVQILREPAEAAAPADKKTEDAALISLSPAGRDLAKLRDRIDPMRTVVILNGMAAETSALHRYLGKLDATEIFDRAELDWFESGEGGAPLRFRVVLSVQPGYGQAGGPATRDAAGLVRTAPCGTDASASAREQAQPGADAAHSKMARKTP